MSAKTKKSVTGKIIDKKDLGRYTKRLGIEPLYKSDKEELYERLYE